MISKKEDKITEVVLVNDSDEQVGTMEKMEAHRKGLLHRAFSVFVFNNAGEMLLQQRNLAKYHSGGLWTNACCSHPFPGEAVSDAATRRLFEELGFHAPLEKIFDFTYRSDFENGLTEFEFDHVFIGKYDGRISPNAEEVASTKYLSIGDIEDLLKSEPQEFTTWFHIAFPKVKKWFLDVRKEEITQKAEELRS
jgi:isopentenyl-diphosphate delta-isomerase